MSSDKTRIGFPPPDSPARTAAPTVRAHQSSPPTLSEASLSSSFALLATTTTNQWLLFVSPSRAEPGLEVKTRALIARVASQADRRTTTKMRTAGCCQARASPRLLPPRRRYSPFDTAQGGQASSSSGSGRSASQQHLLAPSHALMFAIISIARPDLRAVDRRAQPLHCSAGRRFNRSLGR